MSFRLKSFDGGREKSCLLMGCTGGKICRQDKGEDLFALLEFRNALAGKLQEASGQGTITEVRMRIQPSNPETRVSVPLPAELKKGNDHPIMSGHNKKEPFGCWIVKQGFEAACLVQFLLSFRIDRGQHFCPAGPCRKKAKGEISFILHLSRRIPATVTGKGSC